MTLQSQALHDPELSKLGPWFHNLHLPDGRQTAPDHPLGDFPAYKWEGVASHIPQDLNGWSALDVGCNAGFYAFELARRGARVTGLDVDEHYLRQARWAAEQLGFENRVVFRQGTVYELAHMPDCWDLILFMGVLYHLRYPLLALDAVAQRVTQLVVLQTLTMPGEERLSTPRNLPLEERERLLESGWPSVAFLEHELAEDATNWWAPNAAAVEAMVRSAGLRILSQPGEDTWLCAAGGDYRHQTELDAATGARHERPR
jgi:tRNA (mo5U34)-methyltransferase